MKEYEALCLTRYTDEFIPIHILTLKWHLKNELFPENPPPPPRRNWREIGCTSFITNHLLKVCKNVRVNFVPHKR